jgi:hypothetical protein
MMARARLPSSVTGMRMFMSVASSTRAERLPTSVTRPAKPRSSSAIWPRRTASSGGTATSTARA